MYQSKFEYLTDICYVRKRNYSYKRVFGELENHLFLIFFLRKLIQLGLDPKKVIIINFEDPRLPTIISLSEANRIFETYLKNVEKDPKFIMLD